MTRFPDRLRQLAVGLTVLLLSSCGGADEPGSPDTTVASVSISAPATAVAPGGSLQLSATVKNSLGNAISSATVAWTSSEQSVATVSSTGLVSAVANGSTVITAISSGKTATVTITVQTIAQDNTVATVSVTSSSSTVAPGATLQMTATARNAAGTALTGLTATWVSSTQSVATVNSSGLLTAVANGTTTITATISGKSGDREITVQPSPAATVNAGPGESFDPQQIDVNVGATVTWHFLATHNVTFANVNGAPANIGDTGGGNVPRTFTAAGTFPYECTIHHGMTGTVVVH
jgi:plastocyanin